MTTDAIDIREVDVRRVKPLRTRVLRPQFEAGRLLDYDGDDSDDAHHFAALNVESGEVVGVVSYLPETLPVDGRSAEVRLRGMAVCEDLRGRGVGAHLLSTTLTKVALHHPRWSAVWASARTAVIEFYANHGFESVGPRFEMPSVGPHQRMVRELPDLIAG